MVYMCNLICFIFPSDLQTMTEKGNRKAKDRWEATVPPCWVPPDPESPQ